jgi:hypothetical protein
VDPFVLLNRTIASVFGKRTPITYVPSTGGTTAGTSFSGISAVLDNPGDIGSEYNGVMKRIWLDGNAVVELGITPTQGDQVVLADGSIYDVNRIDVDAENGISLLMRRVDL